MAGAWGEFRWALAGRYATGMLKTLLAIGLTMTTFASVGCTSGSGQRGTIGDRRAPAEVEAMLAEISPERVIGNVDRLASFGTRHTMSDTTSDTRGVGAARRWILSQFEEFSRESGRTGNDAMRVYFDAHEQPADGRRIMRPVEITNVIAEIPGAMPEARDRRYYMLGHADSRASDPLDAESDAPGANDDASGVAALMELARVMAKHRYDSTIVLMATTGEEQGLYGARLHAEAAKAEGMDVRAVLNNDTVGDPAGQHAADSAEAARSRKTIRVFSEGVPRVATMQAVSTIARLGAENDSPARQLARYMAEVAELHDLTIQPTLIYRNDRFLRGGDHTAFIEAGYPAGVRLTVMHEEYNRQHQDVRVEDGVRYGDELEFVEAKYLANVTKLNGAALAHLANAPSAPGAARLIIAELMNDTTIRWDASPEPDVAGYEVLWRETSAPTWQHARDVGPVTEATIELSKDNWLFGVRAYDREGYRSPVVFPIAARE